MVQTLTEKILTALSQIVDEDRGQDIVTLNMVSGLEVSKDGDVLFLLEVPLSAGAGMEPLRQKAESAAKAVPGVKTVSVILTAERPAVESASAGPDPHNMNKNPPLSLPIRHIIAVGSGKGGVGKSTVAFNLAYALSQKGLSVGLMDADIYGPSVPHLSGMTGQKPEMGEGRKLIPPEAHGLKLMSMGFLVDAEKPMIWRGPMVQSAFYQMLRDVDWTKDGAPLDVLVIDLPPGTGDVQLTLAQKISVTGAVIVSTPQDLALLDARKAIAMFEKTGVKILGLIENMSFYICPSCGHTDHIFGHGGARAEAEKQGVPFLGEIPLSLPIREAADEGRPVAGAYIDIADKVRELL